MTNEETINLLKTLSQTVDKLASFDRKKGDEKGDTIVNEDDKLSSTLSTTEKRRWETMSKILAKSIKDIVFPKSEEKVGRPEFKQKEVKDLVLSPTLAKLEDKSNKWIKALLGALALLAGIVSGAIAEIVKMLKGLKLFLSETKLGKFIKEIFSAIKLKILELLKPIRETKFVKFIEDALKEKVIKPIAKLFETIGRVFKIVEGGKGPLLMMKAFPTFFRLFEDYIRIAFKVFQVGSKIGRLVGKILGPVLALFEVIVGLVEAFNDPKLKDKSFLQKVVTGLTKGLLNFFDFFEILGLDLFKFETIRDRIEEIFKPFREGKWLQGLSQIGNQLSSVIISIPGKIVGWIIGWFDKDLGKKISDFFDRFDLGKFYTAIAKRIGNIFDPIINLFKAIEEKFGPYITPILKLLGGPVMWAFELLKKTFEYIAPLMKEIASLASKFFGYIKNFFVMIWDGIKSLADKISQIPFMKKVGEELKAIASESQITEMPTPAVATTPIFDVSSETNMANRNLNDLSKPFSVFTDEMNNLNKTNGFNFENLVSKIENNPSEAFSMFGDQMGNLNKTNTVNNKIAVDQLREFKTLNQKFDMLMEQLANGKNVVNNVINQSTQNSFPQSTSVFDLRQGYRGN
jgi:ASC-1-like (ASCH) protein